MLAAALLLLVGGPQWLPKGGRFNAARLEKLRREMEDELAQRIFTAKFMARQQGLLALGQTLGGLAVVPAKVGRVDLALDHIKARNVAVKFSDDWAEKATKQAAAGVENPIGAASEAIRSRQVIVAEVESSESWNDARTKAAADVEVAGGVLVKTWSSALERNTCGVCRTLDGRTILAESEWPYGEPGSVHPRCKCDDHYEVVPRWMAHSLIEA
jgi:hypothetical protein